MATIFITRTLAGAPANATTVKLRDSGGTYGIKRNSDGVVLVPPTGPISPTVSGDYEYDVTTLTPDNYTASWEITVGTNVRYFVQVFNIDASVVLPDGLYLRTIEQEVARILGPYDDMEVGTSSSNTLLTAYIPELASTIAYGGIEDRYMLRRGLKSDGSKIQGFAASDRVRSVATVDTSSGVVTADRSWANSPVLSEVIEFHHLHPLRELRKAVLAGLARCYFWDRISVLTTGPTQEVNITSLIPWLKNQPDLIRRVETSPLADVIYGPRPVREWRPFSRGGNVYLRVGNLYYPQNLYITVLRPVISQVNGTVSLQGPDDDDDILAVDLAYARAAGHIEAWRLFPRKLFPVAQTHLYPSQQQAANEFTLQSQGLFHSESEPDFPKLEWDYGIFGSTS